MDGIKIGGVFYGLDVQKAMEKAHIIVMDAAKKVYQDDFDHINTMKAAIDCYEIAFLERLKNDK
jgi:hypothetical protein